MDDKLGLTADELLAQISDAVIVTDLDDVIRDWNHAAEELYGWSLDEARGRRVAEVLKTEFFAGDRDTAREVLQQRGTWRGEVAQFHRSGKRIIVSSSVTILTDEDDEPIGIVAVNRDVTRLRELERDVLRVAKLESVAFVAGGIAHDVKNMLSGAMGLAELINRRAGDTPAAKFASELKESLRGAATLTERMVSYSRKGRMNIEVVDLNKRLENSREILQRLVRASHRVKLECGEEQLPVRFEPEQFDQIVMNLLVNARDAMPDGGKIVISTSREEDDGTPPVAFARIEVTDEGVGMDGETVKQIFEPHFTTKAADLGTGFGLATVRDIVQRYHGNIEVESTPGVGSKFIVRLPLAPSAQPGMKRRG
jgi:PAS domain S-box-containing protein